MEEPGVAEGDCSPPPPTRRLTGSASTNFNKQAQGRLPAQEAGAPIRTLHDRIVDGMVNLIHLAGISNYTVEDSQILQPVVNAQTIARLEQGASKKANKEDKEFLNNWRIYWVRPDLVF